MGANEVKQWRDYAAFKMPCFNLIVPRRSIAEAKKLAKGIAFYIVGYSEGANGQYVFSKAGAPN